MSSDLRRIARHDPERGAFDAFLTCKMQFGAIVHPSLRLTFLDDAALLARHSSGPTRGFRGLLVCSTIWCRPASVPSRTKTAWKTSFAFAWCERSALPCLFPGVKANRGYEASLRRCSWNPAV